MVDENWGDGNQHVRVELHYWIQDANFNSHIKDYLALLLVSYERDIADEFDPFNPTSGQIGG